MSAKKAKSMTWRAFDVVLVFAFVIGFGYLFVLDLPGEDRATTLFKGAGVWLLAIWAAFNARTADGWLIAIVLALGSLGDVLIERDLTQGALAFAAGHLVAISLYWRNRRALFTPSQKMFAFSLAVATPLIAWFLTNDGGVALYSLILGLMAAAAWTSRFPRYRVGMGAVLFLISDLIIFAQMSVLSGQQWADYAIWLLYFAGQALIALGFVLTLRGEEAGR